MDLIKRTYQQLNTVVVVMVRGCFAVIDGTMNSPVYQKILLENAISSTEQ